MLEFESRVSGLIETGREGANPVGVEAFEVDEDLGLVFGVGSRSSMQLASGTSANIL